MEPRKLTFPGHDGQTLAGRLDRALGPRRGTAVFAHCFTCGKDIAAARRIAGRLAAEGFDVLRFDFTGLGHSEGEFANTHFTSNVGDLVAACRHLEAEGQPVDLLVGHSLGGAAVIRAAAQVDSVRAVATIGAPSDPSHVAHNFGDRIDEIEREGEAEVSLAGRPFRIRRAFLEDVRAARLSETLTGLRRALLILHAPRDEVVGIDNAAEIFTAAKHPKSFVTLDDADHLLTRPEDADYAARVIATWAARYLPDAPAAGAQEAPEGAVRSAEVDPSGFLQDIRAGAHALAADEPPSVGGADRGPTPYQLLSAALAACTSMTIRMYARRKELPLERVAVDVTHEKIHASDCEDCETREGKIDRLDRRVHLWGDLDEAARTRLMEIADRCPVHRTLEGEIRIRTRAGDG